MQAILITGAAGHIGRSLITAIIDLPNSNYRILAIDKNDAFACFEWESLGEKIHSKCEILRFDLSSPEELNTCISRVLDLQMSVCGIVHLASYVGTDRYEGWSGNLSQQSAEIMRTAFQISVISLFEIIKGLTPSLFKSTVTPSVVSVGSIYGSMAPDFQIYRNLDMFNPAAYGVCKAGLAQLTRWFASYFGPDLRFNIVSAGGIERGQHDKFQHRYVSKVPMNRLATEMDVVKTILFLLSDQSAYISGQNIFVDGGYSIL